MYDLSKYLDLVANAEGHISSLNPATIVLANMLNAQLSVFQFHDSGAVLDSGQVDDLEAQISDMFDEINTIYTTPLATLQTFNGYGVPFWDFTSTQSAGNIGLRFQTAVDGQLTRVRYYIRQTGFQNGAIAGLWTSGGTLIQQESFANNLIGWAEVRFDPIPHLTAGTRYVVSVYTPNTSHPFDLGAATGGFTNGDLIASPDGTGGLPTCPGSAGAFGFPTTSSSGARNYVDLEFIADA